MRIGQKSPLRDQVKRGDTIIEVMFAFAIFTLIAIITLTMMNLGIAASERSLELVTARNELNAQAEALRFIHSSYISELNLPLYDDLTDAEKAQGVQYQQYRNLWNTLTRNENMNNSSTACGEGVASSDCMNIEYPLLQCEDVYKDQNKLLVDNHAFIVNTRQLLSSVNNLSFHATDALIYATPTSDIFVPPTLNARILYARDTGNTLGGNTSDDRLSSISNLSRYTRVAKVEGIWVVGVKGPVTIGSQPQYYDFYIETCWYGSGNAAPTSLDAVIRLYNPEGVR